MKKLLLLGGSRYLRPILKASRELGLYTITCDYLPNNYAHKYSDEYHNVSITDKDAVLRLALSLNVDGVMSFACDPGVTTAAYVAERMGLPTHPYESVKILQNKALFRQFLRKNGFNVPKSSGYTSIEAALKESDQFAWPIIVKPTDTAGSKGVRRVDDQQDLKESIEYALKYSLSGEFIMEEFVEKQGDSSDTDCFSVNGELVFASFNNQKFDIKSRSPYVPSAYTWPCEMPMEIQASLREELQRLMNLLHLQTSIYNVETRWSTNGKPYIMECSPRGGGNRLAEVVEFAAGADLIKNAVRAAVGLETTPLQDPVYDGYWAEIILHSDKDGIFCEMTLDDVAEEHLYQNDLWAKPGESVQAFTSANFAIGTLVLRFRSLEEMNDFIQNREEHIKVVVKQNDR